MTKFRPRKSNVSERVATAFEERYAEDTAKPVNVINTGDDAKRIIASKERATFYLPSDLVEELRNAVVALRGAPERFTMTGIVEAALRTELGRLATEHNSSAPFPKRKIEPYVGRPPK
ncbi:MAG: hypothetical protein K8H88_19250 [Sandaracinaceae bacterium]|nr:hypothetical protein [Sandaracinaceae bacterium]